MHNSLNFLQLIGQYPAFASVGNADGTPPLNGLVGDVHSGALMNDKLIGAALGRSLLDVDGWGNDDGTYALGPLLSLLVGKEIAAEKEHEHSRGSEKGELAQGQLGSEQIDEQQDE